ncbi:MAG: lysylphosphatidylglycerol synthase domain-containing protein [Syntrophomonadales bacterium]
MLFFINLSTAIAETLVPHSASVISSTRCTPAMLPIFPGGLGGFEGTMSTLLLIMGLSLSEAAMVAVVFRFITFWFVIDKSRLCEYF